MRKKYRVLFADLAAERTEAKMNELAEQGYLLAGIIEAKDGKTAQIVMEFHSLPDHSPLQVA